MRLTMENLVKSVSRNLERSIKDSLFADITTFNKKKKFSHSSTNIKLKEKYDDLILKKTSGNILIVNDIMVKNEYDNTFLNNQIYEF